MIIYIVGKTTETGDDFCTIDEILAARSYSNVAKSDLEALNVKRAEVVEEKTKEFMARRGPRRPETHWRRLAEDRTPTFWIVEAELDAELMSFDVIFGG